MTEPERWPSGCRDRIERALLLAARLHDRQFRKGTQIPYLSHVLAVAALVAEHGGDADQFIAGLLHDGPEDAGGEETLRQLEREFGNDVASIVAACSDTFESPKPAWKARKERHLAELAEADPRVLLVFGADKLHNARSLVESVAAEGPGYLDRFNGGRQGTLWYYRSAADLLARRRIGPIADKLADSVRLLHEGIG